MKNKYLFGEVFKLLIHVAERKEVVHKRMFWKANVLLYKKHFRKKFKKKEKYNSIE